MTSNSNINNTDNTVLNGALLVISKAKDGIWNGTMTDLNSAMRKVVIGKKGDISGMPRSPSSLRVVLNRIINRLRSRGVSVKFGRTTDATRTRHVEFVMR